MEQFPRSRYRPIEVIHTEHGGEPIRTAMGWKVMGKEHQSQTCTLATVIDQPINCAFMTFEPLMQVLQVNEKTEDISPH